MSPKLIRFTLVFGTSAFFALMWALMLRAHLPAPLTHLRPDYERLLKTGESERSTAWGIYLGERRIGRSDVQVRRHEDGTIVLRTKAEIGLDASAKYLVGVTGTLDVEFQAAVSPLRGLLSFQMDSKLLKTSLRGMVRNDEILLIGELSGKRMRTLVPYDERSLLGEAFSPVAALPELKDARAGQSWTIRMMNPISGRLERATVRIERSKELELSGRSIRALQLSFTAGASRWASWVTNEGDVLVQETPFGLTLRREDLPAAALTELSAEAGTEPRPPQ